MRIKHKLLATGGVEFIDRHICFIEGAPEGFVPAAGPAPVAGPAPAPNNPQGNPPGFTPPAESGTNNTSTADALASFWDDKPPEGTPPQTQDSGAAGQLGTQLAENLKSMSFGQGVMDDKVVADMNAGNFESFNTRFVEQGREIARQALGMSVQVMAAVRERIMAEVRAEMSGTLSSRDNNDALVAAIPSAADPKIRPIAQSIFDRAMKLTKGDRTAALGMTKDMLRVTATTTASDTGLTLAPKGPGDSAPAPKTNWLEELMGQ